MKDKIQEVLDKSIRPVLERDGGSIELVDVKDGMVKVKLKGACAGCPGARMTLEMVVLNAIKEKVPEITSVEAVEGDSEGGCSH